jgi:hypothetical protein
MRVYISGPYSHKTAEERVGNVSRAREAMVQLLTAGAAVFCPHTMTEGLEHDDRLTYEHFMDNDLEWLRQCNAMLLLPGWENSKGTLIELEEAHRLRIPVYSELKNLCNVVRLEATK